MLIFRVLGWSLLSLVALAAVAGALDDIYRVAAHTISMSPDLVCTVMWDLWLGSWIAAIFLSRRVAARPLAVQEMASLILPAIGFGLLGFGSLATHFTPLWNLPEGLGWVLATVCGAGLLVTWWARVTIGSLWSAAVSLKEGHSVVQSGPYRLVRHPIYTGLIIAALAHAIVIGQATNLTGALLLTVGFWLKARLEERFLSEALGASAYADYRRKTPMLIPLWPLKA